MPPATGSLILANLLGFLLQVITLPDDLADVFGLWVDPDSPIEHVLAAPWQLVTYSFLHSGWLHLGLNLFALWMFGADVERVWGTRRFLAAYFAAVASGALAQVITVTITGDNGVPMIGATAGVFGILLCFGLLFPRRRLRLVFPPIRISALALAAVLAALVLLAGVTGPTPNVAELTHLGGLLGGWLVYWYGAPTDASA